jgi:hypothetical protein
MHFKVCLTLALLGLLKLSRSTGLFAELLDLISDFLELTLLILNPHDEQNFEELAFFIPHWLQ